MWWSFRENTIYVDALLASEKDRQITISSEPSEEDSVPVAAGIGHARTQALTQENTIQFFY